MTTRAATYQRNNGGGVILLALAVIAGAFVVALAIPQVINSAHAGLHSEAEIIRQCAADPANLQQIWLNRSGERLNCVIRLPDGRVADYVLQPCKRGVLEITAYIAGNGSLTELVSILASKGCTMVWPR